MKTPKNSEKKSATVAKRLGGVLAPGRAGMKRIYIAGPMTGIPKHNFPAFYQAERDLLLRGFLPINPARNFDGRTDLPYAQYLRRDIQLLLDCQGVVMLEGWQQSRGAKLEYAIAATLGVKIWERDGENWCRLLLSETVDVLNPIENEEEASNG